EKKIKSKSVHVIGLGCGGGQKDAKLLGLLKSRGKKIFYAPCDVSSAMVLVAREAALAVLPEENCFPLVCDLATTSDLKNVSYEMEIKNAARLITFFGMIPNFEPQMILPKLAALIRPKDSLLFSANLAPGKNYAAGVKKVLPQYDNPATHDWLMTFLLDLGVERNAGELLFEIKDGVGGLKRIVADFNFLRSRRIEIEDKCFEFRRGESIRLFFSYRYTPELVRRLLEQHDLKVSGEWIAKSEEEGVFFCRRK
ncbi:MAG: L-histidine N(alpha)-methyltransferase, partial [Verrucomicrobiota bacterium]